MEMRLTSELIYVNLSIIFKLVHLEKQKKRDLRKRHDLVMNEWASWYAAPTVANRRNGL